MSFERILVVKMSALGDVIHALPVSYALKQAFPKVQVTWVIEKAFSDILLHNPYIDEVVIFEKKKFRSFGGILNNVPPLAKQLKGGKFDLALDLQGLFKSAAIVWLSGAHKRLGFCNMREMSDKVSQPVCGPNSEGHVVQRYLDVVRALGAEVGEAHFPIVLTDDEIAGARRAMQFGRLDPDQPYVVLALGAGWPNKRWPVDYFAKLSDRLFDAGVIPVLVGGPGDRTLADEMIPKTAIPPIDLIGKTSLKQLCYVIKQSKLLVGGDTGPLHLAAALGTKVVALMGPTDVNRNGPYGQTENAITIQSDCAGCWKRQCMKGIDCLEQISVERVWQKVEEVINDEAN